jgi:hypothetical protein
MSRQGSGDDHGNAPKVLDFESCRLEVQRHGIYDESARCRFICTSVTSERQGLAEGVSVFCCPVKSAEVRTINSYQQVIALTCLDASMLVRPNP